MEPLRDQFAVMISKASRPTRPRPVRLPIWGLLRVFLLAAVAVGAGIYALVRYYTYVPAPMVVPVDAGGPQEIPAPELEGD